MARKMVSTVGSLAVLLTVVVAASAVSFSRVVHQEWKNFKLQHNKQYSSKEEEVYRMKVFVSNKYRIAKHNERFERGQVSFSARMNQYGDWTQEEFGKAMNGFNQSLESPASKPAQVFAADYSNWPPPWHMDWRNHGAVTPVKNQMNCGACWAFSATGALEGQHFLKRRRLVSLSEQNLIDCSKGYGTNGCEGGTITGAFQYVKDNHGIDSESAYPYQALFDICRYNPNNSAAQDIGFESIQKTERDLQWVVAYKGPVAAAMHANPEYMQFYEKGIYYDKHCSSKKKSLNHGVLVVGYGTDRKGVPYWLVKNSSGEEWGERGYFRLARNRGNHCGIATDASLPIV